MSNRGLNTILPPGYNSADYIQTFLAVDDTDTAVDISPANVTIEFTLRDRSGCEKWTGTVGNGVTKTGVAGEYTVWIPRATMSGLDPGDYSVGCVLANGTVAVQHLRGALPVLDGFVA